MDSLEKLDTVIKLHILWMLDKYGSQLQAAKAMGISPRTIRNYLRRMGIPPYQEFHGRTNKTYKEPSQKQRDEYLNKDK